MAFLNLSCERDDRELFCGLNGTIKPGQILRIAGPNGAGKTTLLRILAALRQPDTGSVLINGVKVSKCRDQILYFGHRSQMSKNLTVLENLQFLTDVDSPVLHSALSRVGLMSFGDSLAGELSQGQGRRSVLARLWCDPPPVWILDEPYTALDSAMIDVLNQRIIQHVAEDGICIFTTHQTPHQLSFATLDL